MSHNSESKLSWKRPNSYNKTTADTYPLNRYIWNRNAMKNILLYACDGARTLFAL